MEGKKHNDKGLTWNLNGYCSFPFTNETEDCSCGLSEREIGVNKITEEMGKHIEAMCKFQISLALNVMKNEDRKLQNSEEMYSTGIGG